MTHQTDLTGQTLGGYRILRKLGQGGMAVVYKAHEESLNRVVALKVIAQHLADSEQFITRFQREAQAAARLSHPNIVQIYAIGEDNGVHFFAMEYVKGRSLGEIIEEEGFLTAGRAVPIITQAAEALAVAHEAGIVHRDIKPANIMLDAGGRVKVADFGIAQMATETRMTQSGMLVGTPEFISPEQCHSEKLDGRSDIYSLGVTFYQLLSGRTPFEADTPASLVLQIVEGPITPIGEMNPTVPPGVQAIVAKMMHVDRDQRFQGAEDLIHALRSVDTQPTTAAMRRRPAIGVAAPEEPTIPASTVVDSEATEPMGARLPATQAVPTNEAATGAPPVTDPATVVSPGTPANEAYSSGRSSNRGALLGVAALVLIVLTVAVVAWQMMGDSGAAERFDPTTDARPQDLPARQEDPAGAPAAAGALEGDTATAGEAAGTGAEPPTSVVSPATSPSGDGGAAAIAAAQPAGTPTTIAGSEPTAAQPSPTPQQPATILQQQGSAQPQQSPADADETPAFIPPPVNSIVADTSGEYEYVDQVHVWFEKAFSEQSFEVVHYPSSPAASLQEAARFHLVTTARLVGTQQLEYFGNVQTQFTIALISRVTDLSTGATVVGPESKTIQYTSTNMQQNLERGTNELARTMARRLRQAMRAP